MWRKRPTHSSTVFCGEALEARGRLSSGARERAHANEPRGHRGRGRAVRAGWTLPQRGARPRVAPAARRPVRAARRPLGAPPAAAARRSRRVPARAARGRVRRPLVGRGDGAGPTAAARPRPRQPRGRRPLLAAAPVRPPRGVRRAAAVSRRAPTAARRSRRELLGVDPPCAPARRPLVAGAQAVGAVHPPARRPRGEPRCPCVPASALVAVGAARRPVPPVRELLPPPRRAPAASAARTASPSTVAAATRSCTSPTARTGGSC